VRSDISAHNIDVLIPVTESALLAVLPARNQLAATVPFPDAATFSAICDKERVLTVAKSIGIKVPRQMSISCITEIGRLELQPPIVIKPSRSVVECPGGARLRTGVSWAYSTEDVVRVAAQYPPAAYPLLLQESIKGAGIEAGCSPPMLTVGSESVLQQAA
jgi:predicted ATP-grasp superfamily ATP-dependent carboligase